MGLWENLFGGNVESHRDGSTTERSADCSVTRNPDGTVRETSRTEYSVSTMLGIGEKLQVSRDAEGNVTNVQRTR
jgi:hypothetical protein